MYNDDHGRIIGIGDEKMHGKQQLLDYPHGESGVELMKNALEASSTEYTPYVGYLTKDSMIHDLIKDSHLPEEMRDRSEGGKVFIANNGAIDLGNHLDFHATGKDIGFKANQNHGSGSKKAGLKDNEALIYLSYKDGLLEHCILYRDKEGTPRKLRVEKYESKFNEEVLDSLGINHVVSDLGSEWTVVVMSGPKMETECLVYENDTVKEMLITGYSHNEDSMIEARRYFQPRFVKFEIGDTNCKPTLATTVQTSGKAHNLPPLLDFARSKEDSGLSMYEFEVPKDPRIAKTYVIYNPKRKSKKGRSSRCLEQIDGQLCSGFVSQNVVQNRYSRQEMISRIRDFGINNDHSSWVVLVELSNECEGTVSRTSHRYKGVSVDFDDSLLVQNIKDAFPQELKDKIEENKATGLLDNDGLNKRLHKVFEKYNIPKDVSNNTRRYSKTKSNSKSNSNRSSGKSLPPTKKGHWDEDSPYHDVSQEAAEGIQIWDRFLVQWYGNSIHFSSLSPIFRHLILEPIYTDPDMKKLIPLCENSAEIIIQEFIIFVWEKIAATKSLKKNNDLALTGDDIEKILGKECLTEAFLPFPIELKKSVRSALKKDQDLNLNTNQEEN